MDSVSPDLDQVTKHRAELRASLSALEHSLAAPLPGRADHWAERVHAAAAELSADFREHVRITEGEDGLYARVLRTQPRLAGAVRRLTAEHASLSSGVEDLLAVLDGAELGGGGGDATAVGVLEVTSVRHRGTVLLGSLVRHRQAGSDLVYEAYAVDIGGSD